MDELKITSPGFDYCIKRTKKVGSRVLCIWPLKWGHMPVGMLILLCLDVQKW
jgi:hypothetical protein